MVGAFVESVGEDLFGVCFEGQLLVDVPGQSVCVLPALCGTTYCEAVCEVSIAAFALVVIASSGIGSMAADFEKICNSVYVIGFKGRVDCLARTCSCDDVAGIKLPQARL